MSGIIAVYALVIAVLIAGDMGPPPQQNYSLFSGFMHLACGLSVGLTGTAAGYAIGKVGDMVRLASQHYFWSAVLKATGRPFVHAAVEDLRRHGFDSHFRRSLGSLWVRTERRETERATADVLADSSSALSSTLTAGVDSPFRLGVRGFAVY